MDSPLPTENPTPAVLISNLFARNVCDMPNSLAAQKHRRLLALTFLFWSYCQMLCMEELGGVPYFLNTIDKFNTSNNFG